MIVRKPFERTKPKYATRPALFSYVIYFHRITSITVKNVATYKRLIYIEKKC